MFSGSKTSYGYSGSFDSSGFWFVGDGGGVALEKAGETGEKSYPARRFLVPHCLLGFHFGHADVLCCTAHVLLYVVDHLPLLDTQDNTQITIQVFQGIFETIFKFVYAFTLTNVII